MREALKYTAMIGFLLLCMGMGIFVSCSNYIECREHGFSVGYCISRK